MLLAFCHARRELREPTTFSRGERCIRGVLDVTRANIVQLRQLEEHGYLQDVLIHGGVENLAIFHPPPGAGVQAEVCLCPIELGYFEDFTDLLGAGCEERDHYYLHPLGEFRREQETDVPPVRAYRDALRAWRFLRGVADWHDPEKTTFLTPGPLEISFVCPEVVLRLLPALAALEAELAPSAVERDQRLALFRRSLREHLLPRPPRERFGAFLEHFDSVYETYRRDFLLWVGAAFSELEKTFEEKRLKFITDLNGILAGIQASLLAVPLAALLVGDKYELANPSKNFFLALTVDAVAAVALLLLANQQHALDAARDSIGAMREDFEKKQSQRSQNFRSRLAAVSAQEGRVRRLMGWFRFAVWGVAAGTALAWAVSFGLWLAAIPIQPGNPAGVPVGPTPGLSPVPTPKSSPAPSPNVPGPPAASSTP